MTGVKITVKQVNLSRMTSSELKSIKLVTGECAKGTINERIALLQMALAAELSGHHVEVVAEDLESAAYPSPRIITSDAVLFAQLSAGCALLRVEDPISVVMESSNVVGDILNGKNASVVPSSLVGQIALFSALHVVNDSKLTEGNAEVTQFMSEFAKRSQVWEALSRVGVAVRPSSHVKEGVEYQKKATVVPKEGERNILITAALPYVNNVPHLGNIIGCLLSADVYARYCRLKGYNSLYICGTDEYGTTTETKALEEGLTCQEVCAKYYRIHAAVYDWFQIECDIFGRTSTERQTVITQDIFKHLYDNGYFFEQSVEQTFCEKCTRFLADRFVEGKCPLCGYHDARGDQCDGCGKLINPVELIDPKCKICKSTPVVKSSKHLFLDLSKLQSACDKFVEASSSKGKWSSNSASIAKGWLTEGLKPRCMTRDLKWGTPVPVEGFEDKVFYVWFDAPIGYLSITANLVKEEWEKWWKNPDNVQLYQFMGKDNVPFHTVIFPSTLLGTNQPFTLLHHINTTEFLNYESGKFSKSRGTGVFGNDARDSGIPATVWRYYLLSNRPEANDSIFTWDDFAAKVNSELLANFGNFINRTVKFCSAKMQGQLGECSLEPSDQDFIAKVNEQLQEYTECMEAVKLRAAIKAVMSISALGNQYLQDCRLDNKLLLNQPTRCQTVISVALNLCYLLSAIVEPFLPSTSDDITSILNAPKRTIPDSFTMDLQPGHCIGTPFLLFNKLDETLVKELRVKYAGKQQQ